MTDEQLKALFAAHIVARHEELRAGLRLVHYTSAEAAFKILTGRQVWLRNAVLMNDFSEIEHGLKCLWAGWESSAGKALQAMLDRIRPGFRDEIAKLFDSYELSLRRGTFITSLSEHITEEDTLGRLSMWRAYGGKCGVAIVMNRDIFLSESQVMAVFSSPVFYQDLDEFVAWFEGWVSNLLGAEEALKGVDTDRLRGWFFLLFRIFAMSTKHPAFAEEREWRVFHCPDLEGTSDWLESAVEIVNGVPQQLVKLSLKDDEAKGVTAVAPKGLINRIIIGPCEHPIEVRAAMGTAMDMAEVPDAWSDEKLWMSLIPLRQV